MQPQAGLIVRQATPFNAEPRLDVLVASHITDTANFYVRSHGSIPKIDVATFSLSVSGQVREPTTFSVEDLQRRFAQQRHVVTLQCAGNRRHDLENVDSVGGVTWEPGAIGTAEWTGVRLADVLEAVGCESGTLHVHFNSCDEIEEKGETISYGVSVSLAKAKSDALLVYEMNGKPLEPQHGGPLRVLVPGYYGVRSVKWISSITVADQPSDNFFQSVDYKVYPADANPDLLEQSEGITLNEIPINAAICDPLHESTVPAGDCLVRGYAVVGDRSVERVEVSTDDGNSWVAAAIEPGEPWSWRLWHTKIPLGPGRQRICARAWDSAAQTQPEGTRAIWNPKGYGNNAWHRIDVTAE